MKKLNVILVYDEHFKNILMCKRVKDPYKGKLNLIGGKVEEKEDLLNAAYRELAEETAITKNDIILKEMMSFKYYIKDIILYVYTGKLNKEVKVVEEVNPLLWIDANSNFFDSNVFAGEGNIGHIVEHTKIYKQKLYDR